MLSPFTPATDLFDETDDGEITFNGVRLLSPELEGELSTSYGLEAVHDVIIQFHSKPDSKILGILDSYNFNHRYTFKVLYGVTGTATGADLLALSQDPNVKHIEINYPMIRDMDMSLGVVNATKAWDSTVLRNNWDLGNIDGTGVTVCVVDTGIDAGHPDLDYKDKTLFNLHDASNGNFIEIENSDLNVGHGTHVAGTVAGNGDASAGVRTGVAPGANLIGLSVSIPEQMSDPTMETYITGLEWVYENTKPGNNPYNIRCATNSWHSTVGEWDPDMALTIITEKITYENNVITTWSAGNDGRQDPEGTGITTSQQGNAPVAIMVAAYERDGSAVTDFSSRGQVGWNHTYPDLGGPGRSIWSCAARRTLISGMSYTGGNRNPYYLAISGTSMSTPHIAGTVALLWQAAPSMKLSNMHEDYSGDDPESWYSNDRTLIHEVEQILEASCTYLVPSEDTGHPAAVNESSLPGWGGMYADYVQGYGLVNVQKAVGIALALEELRSRHPDKDVDVFDAIENYDMITGTERIEQTTDSLSANWAGEYSRYMGPLGEALSTVNQTRKVYIPQGAGNVHVELKYSAVDRDELKYTNLGVTIDFGDDGSVDFAGDLGGFGDGKKTYEIPASGNDGKVWTFDLIGQGLKIQNPFKELNYVEHRAEYDLGIVIEFPDGLDSNYTRASPWYSDYTFSEPSGSYNSQKINQTRWVYDLSKAVLSEDEENGPPDDSGISPVIIVLLFLGVLILAVVGVALYRKYKK